MLQLLQNLYLFKGLEQSDLALVEEISELKLYRASENIFHQADTANSFYVIQRGSVRIDQSEDDENSVQVATLGTGSHFGEMAMLDNEPRSATASAISDSDIVRVPYDPMIDLLKSNSRIEVHFYRELSKFLCSRLRFTTLDLSYSRSQNVRLF
jgi:CRP-like cAMP-binding protein